MTDELDRANSIFVADMVLAEQVPGHEPFGMVEIARFLTTPTMQLSFEQSRKLFADPALRQGYEKLRTVLSVHELPTVIAASDGEIDRRSFEGGRIDLIPSGRPEEWYLRVEISDGNMPAEPMLLVEAPEGGIHKLALANPDSTNAFLVLLDVEEESQGALLHALRDPLSTGCILSSGRK